MTTIELSDVGETALWNLYSRAHEARRSDGVLDDPECIRLYEAIEFDYAGKFGTEQNGLHAEKGRIFDTFVRAWLADHPSGTVVELGAGLETEFQRVDNGTVSWLSIDLPDVIAARESFIPAGERQRYLAADVRDLSWLDEVGPGPVLFTAQGLFMFLSEDQVRAVIVAIVDRFPGAELVFDIIAPLMSKKSLDGFELTKGYRLPAMPWGVKRTDIAGLLRQWHAGITDVDTQIFASIHGAAVMLKPLAFRLPVLRDIPPNVVHVKTATAR